MAYPSAGFGLYDPDTGLVANRNDPRFLMAQKLLDQKTPDSIPGKGAFYASALGGVARALASAKLLSDARQDGQEAGKRQQDEADGIRKMLGLDFGGGGGGAPPAQTAAPEPAAAPAPAPRPMPTAGGGGGGAISPPPDQAPIYAQAAQDTGIPVNYLIARDHQESRFNPNATGAAGELGSNQILPTTAANPGFGLEPLSAADARNPAKSIPWSARYLAAKAKAAGVTDWNDPEQAARGLAAYNGAGPQAAAYGRTVLGLVPRVSQGDAMAAQLTGGAQKTAAPEPTGFGGRSPEQLQQLALAFSTHPNPLVRGLAPMLQQQATQAIALRDRNQARNDAANDRQSLANQRERERADRLAELEAGRRDAAQARKDAADQAQAAALAGRGYRMKPDGTMEVIKGGPADTAPAAPGFAGNGMEQQSANVMLQLGPKVANGTATDQEHAQYALAYNHMAQGSIQTVPDPKDPTGKTMVLARIPGNIPQGFPTPRTPPQQGAGTPDPTQPASGPAGQSIAANTPAQDPRAPQVIPGTSRPDKDANEAERVAAGFASRMAAADEIMRRVGTPDLRSQAAGSAGTVGNFFNTDAGQQYQQAAQAWIRAKLRKESGAAIGKDEMAQEFKTYFPQPGDGEAVLAQKQASREAETRAMRLAAGRAYGMPDPASVRKPNPGKLAAVERARQMLGPNASDDDVLAKAQEIFGR